VNDRLYRSLADSFRLEFYLPGSGLINPPAATYAADANLAAAMASAEPPQAVLMNVAGDLSVLAPDGKPVGALIECLRMIRNKAYPILRFETAETGAAIAALCDGNCLGDVTLCVPYEQRALLPAVRALMPLSRGMLDVRGMELPSDVLHLSGECHAHDATMLMVGCAPSRSDIRRLQKRFVQVWCDADPVEATLSGACGVVTQEPAQLYALYRRFPERTTARPTPLYAHKGLHSTGEFPENSIKATVGAGKNGYDAAEIDIKLTADDVAIVHHDNNTANLFDGDRIVCESTFEQLSALRRKGFAQDGLDRFDDLMVAMAEYPETPVLIEIKTPAATFGAEEMIFQMAGILARPDVQKNCTCIMGVMPPYLSYVHRRLPYLPVAHCTGAPEPAPETADAANLLLYKFAQETKGANAGWNPFHPAINALFGRIAHLRGVTLFPWTWAFKPWEDERDAISAAFAAGYDGLTSDWVNKFADYPVDILCDLPARTCAGRNIVPAVQVLLRSGETMPVQVEILPLAGDIACSDDGFTGHGAVQLAFVYCSTLPDGKPLNLCSRAYSVVFE